MTLTHTKFQAPFVGLGWQRQSDSVGSSGRTFLRVRATNRAMLALANNYFAILMSAQGGDYREQRDYSRNASSRE